MVKTGSEFTHLHIHSNFSFKDSTCSIDDIVSAAAACKMPAAALTDHNNLCGAVRFYYAALNVGVKPLIGVEITTDTGHLTLLAENDSGYSELCRLISHMHLGSGTSSINEIAQYHNLLVLSGCDNGELVGALPNGRAAEVACRYHERFGGRYYIELQHHRLPDDPKKIHTLASVASRYGIPIVATNNVHYLKASDYLSREILSSMGQNVKVDGLNQFTFQNGEYGFKTARAMYKFLADYPEALSNTLAIAERCNVKIPCELVFPRITLPDGYTAKTYLRELCDAGVKRIYGDKPQDEVGQRLGYELSVIDSMGFNDYFIIVWDIVNYAKRNGIRCAGRGSAADSLVSCALGITNVDPIRYDLLFERFLNPERKGMPDIDIDFDSNRRDEVINYIYAKYGKDMVAMVCTVNTMGARSAVREISKAFGLNTEQQSEISKRLPYCGADQIETAIDSLPELQGEFKDKPYYSTIFHYAKQFADFPRHLGIHNGGVIVADRPLNHFTPLQFATKGIVICQHDKDDVEKLGLVKMDLLGLKMLSIITDTVSSLGEGGIHCDIDNIPDDDETTYALLRSARTIGVFQLESPGMRELLGRLQPTRFEDVIANISLFRPGPMQGQMISPFIARRHGRETFDYMHPLLEPALRDTYGVIVYQEQVLRIGHLLAGFSLGQADLLRRAMTKHRSPEEMAAIREQFISGCMKNGVDQATAELVYSKVAGFAAYGFNKAHAASFGWIAYQSAYLKAYYPREFLCATLNNYPCGFYPPWVITWEAKRMGIEVLPPSLDSQETCSVEGETIRLGFNYLPHSCRPTVSCDLFGETVATNVGTITKLNINTSCPREKLKTELGVLGFALTLHPLVVFNVNHVSSEQVEGMANGAAVVVAGIIVTRQTPPTRSGKRIIFLTLQDEKGLVDVTVFPDIQPKFAKVVYSSSILQVKGTVRKTGVAGFSITAREIIGIA